MYAVCEGRSLIQLMLFVMLFPSYHEHATFLDPLLSCCSYWPGLVFVPL